MSAQGRDSLHASPVASTAAPEGQGTEEGQSRQRLLDSIPLTTKLIVSMLVLLVVGTLGISLAIRQMAGTYLLQKTDTQLIRQAKLGIRNATLLNREDLSKHGLGPTDYFLQVRDSNMVIISDDLNPMRVNGVVSVPKLPADGQDGGVQMGQPFTTPAVISKSTDGPVDRDGLKRANAPWRVVAMRWSLDDPGGMGVSKGVLFIGLSLGDQQDTIHALTQYCWMVGILIVLLGAVIAALLIQNTLAPLKRMEKTAAKIAAGDLSRRIPAGPVNTEVGSLAASLNAMLARIERSFREQQATTEKMKQFVSDASHELRTPLAAIHGYAELYRMQRELPGALERADESIGHIEASSTRMTELVQDLLSLARMDEGRGVDTSLDVNLTSLVNDAVDDLHALDPDREITRGLLDLPKGGGNAFVFRKAPWERIDLVGDPTRLRQVVTNIIGNVHRYTPPDSPVEIGLGRISLPWESGRLTFMPPSEDSLDALIQAAGPAGADNGGDYVIMRFSDHGPGASQEALPRLFERFYTADPSRARLKGGTGLGLAIVRSIVKAHQGLICASATPGGGLTFTVVLPQGRVDAATPQGDAD